MKASVVILAYNQREIIEVCLTALTRQRLEEDDSFEVVLVDNGSTDGTGEMIQGINVDYPLKYRYIPRTEQSNRAVSRNQGIVSASGDIVILLDGDQIAAAGFIAEHLRVHKFADNKLVIGFRQYLEQGAINGEHKNALFDEAHMPPSEEDERFWLMERFSENAGAFRTAWHLFFSCNISVRRERLIGVGMFDDKFKGWGLEDSELGYRLEQAGGSFIFNKKALVYHVYHPSEFNEDRFIGWHANLQHFISCHPGFEVEAQKILTEFFNPEIRLSWWDCYVRFENVVRAYQGYEGSRYPVSVIVVYRYSTEVIKAIVSEAAAREVAVIDKTVESNLDLVCQSVREAYDVLYYQQPTEKQLVELYLGFSLRGIWRQQVFD
ncbi:glycosyltransferase family 2 protein [Paenibacillus lentus]|uniref:Glycosyltransferase n=1 Tax=Paenibacillus lentus TaxID=1338368 RepID=A0A3Q8SCC3_9BACL|nr:glycosyltransferase [Paenibacillus lentus]AZK47455.1 glycosyltransferase [Paenibacillus lentus]